MQAPELHAVASDQQQGSELIFSRQTTGIADFLFWEQRPPESDVNKQAVAFPRLFLILQSMFMQSKTYKAKSMGNY